MASKASILARMMGVGNTTIANPAISSPTISNATLTSPTISSPTISNATLSAPVLGTPASGNLSNCAGVQYTGFKNRIINGNMAIWQRGTARKYYNTYATVDRWGSMGYQDASTQRVSISSPPTGLGSIYACRVGSSSVAEASAGTRMDFSQKIESVNCIDLGGQTVSVSFWIKFSSSTFSSSTVTQYDDFHADIQYNTTTTDSASMTDTAGVAGNGTINGVSIVNGSLPTSWTKYSYTYSIPVGIKNLSARFCMGNLGSTSVSDTNYYDITEVQLEKGSVATSFDYRPYGTELALCQRYYYQETGGSLSYPAFAQNSTTALAYIHYPNPMRATPTCAVIGSTASNWNFSIGGSSDMVGNVMNFGDVTQYTTALQLIPSSSSVIGGQAGRIRTTVSSGGISFSAEL